MSRAQLHQLDTAGKLGNPSGHRRPEKGRRCSSALLLASVLCGCYTYRPLVPPEPVSGTRVSAELTEEGSRSLSGEIGPAVEHVEGQVLRVDSTGVQLSVIQVEGFKGIQSDWNGEPVVIP